MLIRFILLGFAVAAMAGSSAYADVAQTQRQLNELGYEAGEIDGLWGGTTRRALEAFLADKGLVFDGQLDSNEEKLLSAELEALGLDVRPSVDWEYRATSILFGGYDRADQPVYDAIHTIHEIPAFGFNVVTLDIRCVGKADTSVPEYYPLGRRIGCSIPNKQILEEEGFASSRRDATSLAIDEARAANLDVNLKPMFLELSNMFDSQRVPADVFFEGDGQAWSGYNSIILALAQYAQENQVEYLTIGTELNNLNDRLEDDQRWSEIIEKIRAIYDGKLIYAHNYNQKSTLAQISSTNVMRYVDIVGLNFFPTLIIGGRNNYSAEDVAIGLGRVRLNSGQNMMNEAEALHFKLQVPIILSETHFPTWQGSADWMFRGGCDYQNEGRSGWAFTLGPLQAKTPSSEYGRILAQGFMLAFEDEEWVLGADYLYWTVSHAYDENTDRQEYGPCSSWLWEKDNGIKEMIRDFQGG